MPVDLLAEFERRNSPVAPGVPTGPVDLLAEYERRQRVKVDPTKPVEEKGLFDAFTGGLTQTGRALGGTVDVLTDDKAGLVERANLETPQTEAQMRFGEAVRRNEDDDPDELGFGSGLWEAVKNVGGAIAEEPRGALHEMVAQLPNSGVVLGGMAAGAKAGAMLGAAAGPKGAVVGGIIGGIAGMFSGNFGVEAGNLGMSRAREEGEDVDTDEVTRQAAVKSGVITAVDTATLGFNRWLMGNPGKAASKVVTEQIDKLGLTPEQVLKSPDTMRLLREKAADAFVAAMPKGQQKAARMVLAGAVETAGEGTGEYLGSKAAGLDASLTEAVLESAMSLPQSAAEVGISAYLGRGNRDLNQFMGTMPDPGDRTDPRMGPPDPNAFVGPAAPADTTGRQNLEFGMGGYGVEEVDNIDVQGIPDAPQTPLQQLAGRLRERVQGLSAIAGLNPAAIQLDEQPVEGVGLAAPPLDPVSRAAPAEAFEQAERDAAAQKEQDLNRMARDAAVEREMPGLQAIAARTRAKLPEIQRLRAELEQEVARRRAEQPTTEGIEVEEVVPAAPKNPAMAEALRRAGAVPDAEAVAPEEIRPKSGQPYKSEASARNVLATRRDIQGQGYEPVEVEGGWVLRKPGVEAKPLAGEPQPGVVAQETPVGETQESAVPEAEMRAREVRNFDEFKSWARGRYGREEFQRKLDTGELNDIWNKTRGGENAETVRGDPGQVLGQGRQVEGLQDQGRQDREQPAEEGRQAADEAEVAFQATHELPDGTRVRALDDEPDVYVDAQGREYEEPNATVLAGAPGVETAEQIAQTIPGIMRRQAGFGDELPEPEVPPARPTIDADDDLPAYLKPDYPLMSPEGDTPSAQLATMLAERMGRGDNAAALKAKIESWQRKGEIDAAALESVPIQKFLSDKKGARVTKEEVLQFIRDNQPQIDAAAEVGDQPAFAPRQRDLGDFKYTETRDGSIVVKGDPEAIRAKLPDDVKGRVTKDGLSFTSSSAPRVKRALSGEKVAYSRAGQVLREKPMKDGKYLGAPPEYNTPETIGRLRRLLRKLTNEGALGRYWYENSSREVLRAAGGNIEEARKFVALLAIYSPQAKVDTNTTFAIRAWAQHRMGQPINVKTGEQDKAAQAAMDDVDAFWSGQKTGNFFFNLLREIDPSTEGKQGATIDMWMMRAGQYDHDAPTDLEYAFMEDETNRLAKSLGWEPQQVQAAIWVAMKARMENATVKAKTEEVSEKNGWISYEKVNPKTGKKSKRKVHNEKAHRNNWVKHAMRHRVTPGDSQRAKFDFADGMQRHIGQVSWEPRISTKLPYMAGIHSAPYEQQMEYFQAVKNVLFDENGVDLLAARLGLLEDSSIDAPGVWEGAVSPSGQNRIVMAPAAGGVMYVGENETLTKEEWESRGKPKGFEKVPSLDPAQKAQLDIYASILGLVLRQDGVGYHRAFKAPSQVRANGITLRIGRPFSPDEIAGFESRLVDGIRVAGGDPGSIGIISTPEGANVVNFGALEDNKVFHKIVRDAAEDPSLPDADDWLFTSDGNLAFNDWEVDTDGQGYKHGIVASGRSDVLAWARDNLAPRIQAVNEEFSERFGWGDPGQIRFSPRQADTGAARRDGGRAPEAGRGAKQEGALGRGRADREQPLLTGGIGGDGRSFTDFFAKVSSGVLGKPKPGVTYKPVIPDADARTADFTAEYVKHRGHFDDHIKFSIPGFGELQRIVGAALARVYGPEHRLLDIGASEGAFMKAVTQLSGMRSTAVDPNPAMAEHFAKTPVEGSEYRSEAFGTADQAGEVAWTEDDGTEIRYFDPAGQRYDVVHEAMVFQFISPERAAQIARVKELLTPNGVAIFEQKLLTPGDAWDQNEAKKNAHKLQYFDKESLDKKAVEILEGMNKNMVQPDQLEARLSENFNHVAQFWDSGNFKGYIASDDRAALDAMLREIGDTSSEYSTTDTPREVTDEGQQVEQEPALSPEQGPVPGPDATGDGRIRAAGYGTGQEGSVSAQGTHYSRERRTLLDSRRYGEGKPGREQQRLSRPSADPAVRNRIYFYVDEGGGVTPEAGVGTYPHNVQLDNLYDWLADPEGLWIEAAAKYPNDIDDQANYVESAVRRMGFDGIYAPGAFTKQGVAVLLGEHVVSMEGAIERDKQVPAKAETRAQTIERELGEYKLPSGRLTGLEWRRRLDAVGYDVERYKKALEAKRAELIYRADLPGILAEVGREIPGPTPDDIGKIVRLTDGLRLNPGSLEAVAPPNAAAARFLRTMERLLGRRIILVKNHNADKALHFNGVYNPRDPDTLFLAVDANRAAAAVIGHEFIHSLAKRDRAQFVELANAILKAAGVTGEDVARYKAFVNRHRGNLDALPHHMVLEEMVADIFGDVMNNRGFWERLHRQNPGRFDQIIQTLKAFLERLLSGLRNNKQLEGSQYVRDVQAVHDIVADFMARYSDQTVSQEIPRVVDRIMQTPVHYAGVEANSELTPEQVSERKRRPAAVPEQVALDLESPAAVSAARTQAADTFHVSYLSVPVGELNVGLDRVTNAAEAAHVLAPIRKYGQETFAVLVLDKDDKVLQVLRHSIGTIDGASVYPAVVAGAVAGVPGSAKIWFAHNHPSGYAAPSSADEKITQRLLEMFGDTGIEVKGHIIVAPGGKANMLDREGGDRGPVEPKAMPRRKTVPVTERMIRKRTVGQMPSVTSPDTAMGVVQSLESDNALVLLNNRHDPVAVVSLTREEMTTLREGGMVRRLLSAIDRSNAAAALIKSSDIEAATNLSKFLNRGQKVRVLDAFYPVGEELVSSALSGTNVESASGAYFSPRIPDTPVFYSELSTQLDQVKQTSAPASQWRGLIKGLTQKGVKQEEIDWSGVDAWLEEKGQDKVTREEIADYLASQEVQVEEVMRTENTGLDVEDPERERYAQMMTEGTARVAYVEEDFDVVFYDADGNEFHRQGDGVLRHYPDITTNRETVHEFWGDYSQGLTAEEIREFLGSEASIPTKYDSWKPVKGGENYKELLLTINQRPTDVAVDKIRAMEAVAMGDRVYVAEPDGSQRLLVMLEDFYAIPDDAKFTVRRPPRHYLSGHWDERNIIAHVRFDERTNDVGERVLMVQEIQSDWHQAGRKEGYDESQQRVGLIDYEGQIGRLFDSREAALDWLTTIPEENRQYWTDRTVPYTHTQPQGVPNAPFKETMTKSGGGWAGLAFKRMIRYAADHGFDRIAWATGEQSADVYDLRKQVDSLIYDPARKELSGWKGRNAVFEEGGVDENRLQELVGKDIAERLLAAPYNEDAEGHEISGQDLAIGGEGLIGFYDRILPRNIGKFVRKWGSKVEPTTIGMTYEQYLENRGLHLRDGRLYRGEFELLQPPVKRDYTREATPPTEVWSVPVTEQMRESAQQGMPLFSPQAPTGGAPAATTTPPAAPRAPSFQEPDEISWLDKIRIKLYEKFQTLQNVQKIIGPVAEQLDAMLRITLYPGRVRARIDDFEKTHLEPLKALLRQSDLSFAEIGEYLHARHAVEANRVLKQRNPNRPNNDRLSGMSDAEAAQVLARHANNYTLQQIVQRIDAINADRMQLLVDEDLLTPAEAASWQSNYRHYVPLHREESGTILPKRGAGFDVRGKESRLRAGSADRPVDHENMIARILTQYEFAVQRAEKNRVAQTLYRLAQANPNDQFWIVDQVPQNPFLRADSTIGWRGDYMNQNVMAAKFGGETRYLTFNDQNAHANQIIRALKNLDVQSSKILTPLLIVNRGLAALNTSLSPEFVISNFFRDWQTAGYNLTDTELKDMKARVLSRVPSAVRGIRNALRGDNTHDFAPYFERFRHAGGMTGWMQAYDQIGSRLKALQMDMKTDGTPGISQLKKVFKAIEDYNVIIENGVRLSAFRAAVEAGMSDAQAARLAKELTVNFNRRGEWGVALNALYLFYNASIQGSVRLLRAVTDRNNKTLHKMLAGTVGFAIAVELMNLLADDDDEYKNIPTQVKDRNLVIMDPFQLTEDGYFKIPLPWGYNVFHIVGQEIAQAIGHTLGRVPGYSPFNSASRISMNMLQAFNPVQDGSILQTISPTILDPSVRIAENKDWHGGRLYPNYNEKQANYLKHFSNARESSKDIAQWMYEATLDPETLTATVDVSPEWIDMMVDFATGSVGRVIADSVGLVKASVTGDEMPELKRYPMLRKVYATIGDSDRQRLFYEKFHEMLTVQQRLRDAPTPLARAELIRNLGDRRQLIGPTKVTNAQLTKLNKAIKAAKKLGDKALEKRIREQRADLMRRYMEQYYRVMYNDQG